MAYNIAIDQENVGTNNNLNHNDPMDVSNHNDEEGLLPDSIATNQDYLAWISVVTNFILAIPSLVFDQLSSKEHHQYALASMVISAFSLCFCIAEFIWKVKSGENRFNRRNRIRWLLGCISVLIGVVCALSQFILVAINYSFISAHRDGPIKISTGPLILSFGVLCSRVLEHFTRNHGGGAVNLAQELHRMV